MLEFPRRVEEPWGHELIWAETDLYVGKILHVKAGHALSRQYHEQTDVDILEASTNHLDDVVRLKDRYGRA